MRKLIVHLLLLLATVAVAQEKDKALPEGNKKFAAKDYASAEAEYRVSKSRFRDKATSSYNLGNSIYRQNQASEAKIAYADAIQKAQTRPQKHYAYHNLGNVLMKEKNYAGAVEAYKNALRNNPGDDQTRYNFALAKKMLKDNPPKDDKKDDKKKDDKKKDDKKDQKDKEQKPDDKGEEKKPEPKPGEKPQPKPGDNGQPKPQDGGISKQRLESLLDAVNNEEKKVQDKVNVKKIKGTPKRNEKDW